MMQDVLHARGDFRNSSADAKVWATYPSDLIRLLVAVRTDSSSSMIVITGTLLTGRSTAHKKEVEERSPLNHRLQMINAPNERANHTKV
jgi:hypothetical protein